MSFIGKRRAYGQHFLRDKGLCARIAAETIRLALCAGCRDILEIGPGKGALTRPLVELIEKPIPPHPIRLVLVERDPVLAASLSESIENRPVTLVEGDFLEITPSGWLPAGNFAVAANLPYSCATAMVEKLARMPDRIVFMLLMFQAEVGRRLRAEAGNRDRGSLSVWMQNRWEVSKFAAVPSGAFSPPPRVSSEVLLFKPRPSPMVPLPGSDPDGAKWENLLKSAFAHRRKMLRSGLPARWRNALDASGVDGTKRAESLDWEEWRALYGATVETD